ncbi:PHP domain-like protein [Pluteus cervinus]|uniref:PHP domain-like protein n=1 Tax=Pluteus cervinus TaxID=181527 RepID=A0ACD3AJW8_9AGAR|nr:PHP domain-like protein [Pluteus cervinus]
MYCDLFVPVPPPLLFRSQNPAPNASKKGKAKQQPPQNKATGQAASNQSSAGRGADALFTAAQLSALEKRVDMLIHLGYSVLALTQTVYHKFEAKTHVNTVDCLVEHFESRFSAGKQTNGSGAAVGTGTLLLKRLNIVLNEESEKGFGLTAQNTQLLSAYDILSLTPTTPGALSLACLTHTLPTPLTTHIISLPLPAAGSSFSTSSAVSRIKHTLVRTAKRNGAAFEVAYVGSLGGEGVDALNESGEDSGLSGSNVSANVRSDVKRNWWTGAREIVRVAKGSGIIVSGGVADPMDLRAPRDVGNLMTLLGLSQDKAHEAITKTPKGIVLRSQTRKTYRAILSEPRVVIPQQIAADSATISDTRASPAGTSDTSSARKRPREEDMDTEDPGDNSAAPPTNSLRPLAPQPTTGHASVNSSSGSGDLTGSKKKKRKKNRESKS